jgi:hypothetical protein
MGRQNNNAGWIAPKSYKTIRRENELCAEKEEEARIGD